jgi:hypothetical protein
MRNPVWDFFHTSPANEPDMDVKGQFECQVCYTSVATARYLTNDKVIIYTCRNGHDNRFNTEEDAGYE